MTLFHESWIALPKMVWLTLWTHYSLSPRVDSCVALHFLAEVSKLAMTFEYKRNGDFWGRQIFLVFHQEQISTRWGSLPFLPLSVSSKQSACLLKDVILKQVISLKALPLPPLSPLGVLVAWARGGPAPSTHTSTTAVSWPAFLSSHPITSLVLASRASWLWLLSALAGLFFTSRKPNMPVSMT